jgi:hypothetical protein
MLDDPPLIVSTQRGSELICSTGLVADIAHQIEDEQNHKHQTESAAAAGTASIGIATTAEQNEKNDDNDDE